LDAERVYGQGRDSSIDVGEGDRWIRVRHNERAAGLRNVVYVARRGEHSFLL
jgi:hypothetical protein